MTKKSAKPNKTILWNPFISQPVGSFVLEDIHGYSYKLKATTKSAKNRLKLYEELCFQMSIRNKLALLDPSAILRAKDLVVRKVYITPKDLTLELFYLVSRYY